MVSMASQLGMNKGLSFGLILGMGEGCSKTSSWNFFVLASWREALVADVNVCKVGNAIGIEVLIDLPSLGAKSLWLPFVARICRCCLKEETEDYMLQEASRSWCSWLNLLQRCFCCILPLTHTYILDMGSCPHPGSVFHMGSCVERHSYH